MRVVDGTNSWNYNTSTWRPWNNSTANRVEWVRGDTKEILQFMFNGVVYSGAGNTGLIGIALDATSGTPTEIAVVGGGGVAFYQNATCHFSGYPTVATLGYHYAQAMEWGGGSNTFYGGNSQGLFGTVWS
jgi:hypothetical protein